MPLILAPIKGGIRINGHVRGPKCPYCSLGWNEKEIVCKGFDGEEGNIDYKEICKICGSTIYTTKIIHYK